MSLVPESTNCCLCGASSGQTVGRGRDYDCHTTEDWWTSTRCSQCRHEYLNPRPRMADASRIYPDDYFGATLTHSDPAQGGFIQKVRRVLETGRYKKALKYLPPNPSVLDVGFGDGRVLVLLRSLLGKDASLTGLDLNTTDLVKSLLKKYDIQLINGIFETADLPESAYDMVVMNQIIEHFWDPQEALRKIRRSLKPNGLLFIETPNPDCLCRRLQGNRFWGGFHFPRHLNWFAHEGLKRLLAENGFSVLDYREFVSPVFWIAGYHNYLANRGNRMMKKIAGCLTLGNVVTLSFFTLVETFALRTRLRASNHRIVGRLQN